MDSAIGTYYALYFEDIASAVEYCQSLVPHIVPRPGASPTGEERSVVWFHVPRRSTGSLYEGCYLFASAGALAAARRGGLDTPMSGRVTRRGLPAASVLLFGEDEPEAVTRGQHGARRLPEREPAPHHSHSTSNVGDASR